jgi:hypothetical protein
MPTEDPGREALLIAARCVIRRDPELDPETGPDIDVERLATFIGRNSPGLVSCYLAAEAEAERLRVELAKTAEDVLAVIEAREPETWAWPLHGLRDALNARDATIARLRAVLDDIRAMAEHDIRTGLIIAASSIHQIEADARKALDAPPDIPDSADARKALEMKP